MFEAALSATLKEDGGADTNADRASVAVTYTLTVAFGSIKLAAGGLKVSAVGIVPQFCPPRGAVIRCTQ